MLPAVKSSISYAVILVVLAITGLLFLWYNINIFLLIFASVLLAIFLHNLSCKVSRCLPISSHCTLILILAVLTGVIVWTVKEMLPIVFYQVNLLVQQLPSAWQKSIEYIREHLFPLPIGQWSQWLSYSKSILLQATAFLSLTVDAATNVAVVLFVGICFSLHPKTYVDGFIKLFPLSNRSRARQIVVDIGEALSAWLFSKLLTMILIGIATTVGLWLLNSSLALTLGLLAGILSFIPNIGPILSAIPAIVLAIGDSPIVALQVSILYIAIQAVESYVVTPWIQQKANNLPAALVILAQILMSYMNGLLGLTLAAPLLIVVIIVIQRVYIEDTLGDKSI